MYRHSQWTENSPGPLHCPDPCRENDPERSRGSWAKTSEKLLLSPTCVHHSGCGLWSCGAGPLWSYNQQEGFQVLGATCWTLLASFGAYSPEKVSHGRIKNPIESLGIFKSRNEIREWHPVCPDGSSSSQHANSGTKGMIKGEEQQGCDRP